MTKTISGEVWAEVVKLLLEKGKNVILAGGPDDEEVIGEIEKNLADKSEEQKAESRSALLCRQEGGLSYDNSEISWSLRFGK